MIKLFGFILECAAVAGLAGAAASLLSYAVLRLFRPLVGRLPAARRADVAFIAGVLPVLAATAFLAAAVEPSVGGLLAEFGDHCLTHLHHAHLCFAHFGTLRPAVAVVGATALSAGLFRAGMALGDEVQGWRRGRRLSALAKPHPTRPLVRLLPGTVPVCHTVGLVRPRIVALARLLEALPHGEAEAVLAHEEEHVRRRDPLAVFVLRLSGALSFPLMTTLLIREFRAAAESACDEEAARRLGDPLLVANVLVRLARLNLTAGAASAFGIAERPIETRVRALLRLAPGTRKRGRHFKAAAMAALAVALLSMPLAPALHHAAESVLHLLS